MRDINKDDAGKYTVKVSNHSGSTEESFMIYISGLPGAPIGPLEVSEITSHTCKLYWSPPEFDGGSKITHYVVERRDIRHNEWIVIASFCKSTNFAVQGLTEGQEYLFRILAANVNGTGPSLDGVIPIRAKPPHNPPYAQASHLSLLLVVTLSTCPGTDLRMMVDPESRDTGLKREKLAWKSGRGPTNTYTQPHSSTLQILLKEDPMSSESLLRMTLE